MVRVVALCLAVLGLVQLALARDLLPWWRSPVEPWEGFVAVPVMVTPPPAEGPWVQVRLVNRASAPRAVLLVNGREAGTFRQPELTVAVASRDVLEVDALRYRVPLVFRVVAAHPEVQNPVVGTEITVRQAIGRLGRVRLQGEVIR